MLRTTRFTFSNFNLLFFSILLISASFLISQSIFKDILISILFSLILLAATFTITKGRTMLVYFAIGIIVLREISEFLFDNSYLDTFATVTSVVFFLVIVFHLIRLVALSKKVDRDVILEAINGYLLMGLSGSVVFGLISRVQENAFAFAHPSNNDLSDYLYFGFVTQTTIGFGDITPLTNLARLLTIAIGIQGQLYIAIIIAMLVGKYISQQDRTT